MVKPRKIHGHKIRNGRTSRHCWTCPLYTFNAGEVCRHCLAEGLTAIPDEHRKNFGRAQMWVNLEGNPCRRRRLSPTEMSLYLHLLTLKIVGEKQPRHHPQISHAEASQLTPTQALRIDLYETACRHHGLTLEELAEKVRADIEECRKHLRDLLRTLGPAANAERALLRHEDGKYYSNNAERNYSEGHEIRVTVMRQKRRKGQAA